MRKLLGRKYYCAQDICGRNVLHLAVLCRSRSLVEYLASHHPQLLNMQDNVRYRSRPDVERLDPEKQFRGLVDGPFYHYIKPLFFGGGGVKFKTRSLKYFNEIFDIQDTHLYTGTIELGFLLLIQFTTFPKCRHPSPPHLIYRRAYYRRLFVRKNEERKNRRIEKS